MALAIRFLTLLVAVFVSACAARQTTPTAISHPGDAALSCAEIEAQIARNQTETARLIGAEDDVVSGNVAAGVVGTLFWPAWLATDLSSAEQIQFRALQDRNENLARIYDDRDCAA